VRRITLLLAFLLICNLAGADKTIVNGELGHVSLDETFTIGVRQSVQLENEDFSIQMLSVLENSICPADAQCIWAGAVVIHVKVNTGQTEEEYLLADSPGRESFSGIPRSVIVDQFQIQFLSLEQNSALLKITHEAGDQKNGLKGIWGINKNGALSSEWHHENGKIIKKSQISTEENITDKKAGPKVIRIETD